jgi:hypothetical protein
MAQLIDPDTWLRRVPAAEALTARGFRVSPATLATRVTRGGGPPFRVFNGIAQYRWGDLLAWAESRAVYRGGDQHKAAA